jgi:fructokinase
VAGDLAHYVQAVYGLITLIDWALLPEGAAARVARTLQLAMKAAAINCTRQGCQPPDWREIQAF